MRVALALIATMLSLAGVYALLGVHVIAMFQVLIYVGAVMVFMVYVIMLLDVRDRSFTLRFSPLRAARESPAASGLLAALLACGRPARRCRRLTAQPSARAASASQSFSVAFLNDYWLHFELVVGAAGRSSRRCTRRGQGGPPASVDNGCSAPRRSPGRCSRWGSSA